jgi:hypothetical protein
VLVQFADLMREDGRLGRSLATWTARRRQFNVIRSPRPVRRRQMVRPGLTGIRARGLTGGLLICGVCWSGQLAWGQTGPQSQSPPPAQTQGKNKPAGRGAKADTQGKTASKQTAKGAAAQQKKDRSEPSEAYQESIRQTVERRRERRARRQAQAGAAVGGIVPWPMPPALVIRHTRDVHDDIGAFLFGLRY